MLDDVAIFIQIARNGSLSMASKKLDMPANTLGRSLACLEQLMDTPLLFRSTQALHCTAAGEFLYRQSYSSIDSLHATIEPIKHMGDEPRGKARVHVSTSFLSTPKPTFCRCSLISIRRSNLN
jgi:DNA-binding transcriptional LysR family regulator